MFQLLLQLLPSAYKKFFVTVGGIRTGSQSQLTPNLRVGVSGSIKKDTKYIFQGLQYSSPSAAGTITTDSVVNLNNASFAALGLSSLFDTTTASNWNAQFEIDTGTSLSFPCINYSAFYSRNSSQSNGVASGRIFYKDETTIDTIQLTTSSGVNWAADGNVTVWGLK